MSYQITLPSFPDAVMSAWRLGGMKAVFPLVGTLIMSTTLYKCPECDGHGYHPKAGHDQAGRPLFREGGIECEGCKGNGGVRVFPDRWDVGYVE